MKSAKFKKYTDINAVNELDLEKAMGQLEDKDPCLEELNLNNHKDVTQEVLCSVAKHLKTNRHLKRLYLANCRMTDPAAKVCCDHFSLLVMYRIGKKFKLILDAPKRKINFILGQV